MYSINIENIFSLLDIHLENKAKFYLFNPSELLDYFVKKKFRHHSSFIKDWDLFEKGKLYFTEEDFFNFIYFNVVDDKAILLSDDGIKNNVCFKIDSKQEFSNFVEVYEDFYNTEIFQPFDYIAFFPRLNKINIIFHEGIFFSFDLT